MTKESAGPTGGSIDPGPFQPPRRAGQAVHDRVPYPRRAGAPGRDADRAVRLGATQSRRVFDGAADAVSELTDAVGVAGDAPLTGLPIFGG